MVLQSVQGARRLHEEVRNLQRPLDPMSPTQTVHCEEVHSIESPKERRKRSDVRSNQAEREELILRQLSGGGSGHEATCARTLRCTGARLLRLVRSLKPHGFVEWRTLHGDVQGRSPEPVVLLQRFERDAGTTVRHCRPLSLSSLL